MSDAALEFAAERGLGKVLGRVRLDSGIAIPGGGRTRADLLLTESGLWLIAAQDRFRGQHLDLLTRGDLRLSDGRIRDRLCFGQEELAIPAGRRHTVERLIALARLSPGSEARTVTPEPCRFTDAVDELGLAWLRRELQRDEVLIAWLRGSKLVTVNSHLIGETRSTPYLLVSERRAAVVVWSAVGDVSYAPLQAHDTQARSEDDKTELTYPAGQFLSRRSNARACRDAFELLNLDPATRLLEAARRLWVGAERGKHDSTRSLSLLDAAISRGSAEARFARLLGGAELSADTPSVDLGAAEQALVAAEFAPHALGDLWLGFRFSESAGSALVRALLRLGQRAQPFALALQRRIYDTPGADPAVAEDELGLAHFAVQARLASSALPGERDRALDRALSAHGLARGSSVPTAPPRSALSAELLEGVLTHPLARGQNSLVAGVQKLVALSPAPDHLALNDYCEALDARKQPAAKRALDAARLAFSLPNLRAYVSRGRKSIGLRGYEGDAPYILLGIEHLDPGSRYCMTEAELSFAIGVEALHLKLGQARLTSHEVWAGAWSHTKGGVELVLGVLPLLRGLPLATSLVKFLDKIPEPALRRGLETAVRLQRQRQRAASDSNAAPGALSHINENLVAAHRLMQMSADRAGLVLCGDLQAALRGLLLVRPDTRALLDAIIERDLVFALLNTDLDPALRNDLVVRVASLLHFFVSDEYLQLRRALD